MAKAFSSITITEVRDGQNGTALEWKGEYASFEAFGEAFPSPQNGWAFYNQKEGASYIYQNGKFYILSQDGKNGEVAGIVDIRYSDDIYLKEFTVNEQGEADGLTQGKYIGFCLVEKTPTLEELQDMFDQYSWSSLETAVDFNVSYLIEKNCDVLLHFLKKDGTFEYVPEIIKFKFASKINEQIFPLNKSLYVCDVSCIYENEKNQEYIYYQKELSELEEDQNTSEYAINLTFNKKIEQIDIVLKEKSYLNDQTVVYPIRASETIIGIYGMSKDMAQLSINAGQIVQSIGDTKLTFGSEGLSVNNGCFEIFDATGQRSFYTTTEGNLILKGSIESTTGKIGGWTIGQNSLYSQNEETIFYSYTKSSQSSDEGVIYNNSPIRIVTGKKTNNSLQPLTRNIGTTLITEDDYSFIVNNDGFLYAENAKISGTIHATSGSIKNTMKIGEDNQGITIYGGNQQEKSYIGSTNFSSGEFGYGWNIDSDGRAEFTDIRARGKITSSIFEYQKISSIGGSLYITPTLYFEAKSDPIKKLGTNLYSVVLTYPTADIANVSGRSWKVQDSVKLECIAVEQNKKISLSNILGEITNLESKNASTKITIKFENTNSLENYILIEGTLLMFYGAYDPITQTKQQSGIYLTASENGGPYIDIFDINNTTIYSPAVRLGNLVGVNNDDFGKLEGFGLYSTNAYLTGELILPNAGVSNQQKFGYAGGELYEEISNNNDSSAIRFWAGAKKPQSTKDEVAPFIVTQDGSLYATKGVFSGIVKAENSEFSGTIKAAGIVIDNLNTPNILEANANHFFVAYSNSPQTYDDYVLDINSKGLSLWEGTIKAYSDSASKFKNKIFTDYVYGYDSSRTYEPLPYFYLIDESNNVTDSSLTINSRAVVYKQHIFQTSKQPSSNDYTWKGVLLDSGIWFANGTIKDFSLEKSELFSLEKDAYGLYGTMGIYGQDDSLYIRGDSAIFQTLDTSFLGDIHIEKNGSAAIHIGGMMIQEINPVIGGLNFV